MQDQNLKRTNFFWIIQQLTAVLQKRLKNAANRCMANHALPTLNTCKKLNPAL